MYAVTIAIWITSGPKNKLFMSLKQLYTIIADSTNRRMLSRFPPKGVATFLTNTIQDVFASYTSLAMSYHALDATTFMPSIAAAGTTILSHWIRANYQGFETGSGLYKLLNPMPAVKQPALKNAPATSTQECASTDAYPSTATTWPPNTRHERQKRSADGLRKNQAELETSKQNGFLTTTVTETRAFSRLNAECPSSSLPRL
jgi:hypothetical protein